MRSLHTEVLLFLFMCIGFCPHVCMYSYPFSSHNNPTREKLLSLYQSEEKPWDRSEDTPLFNTRAGMPPPDSGFDAQYCV